MCGSPRSGEFLLAPLVFVCETLGSARKHAAAAGLLERVELQREVLLVGGDARVADQVGPACARSPIHQGRRFQKATALPSGDGCTEPVMWTRGVSPAGSACRHTPWVRVPRRPKQDHLTAL